MARSLCVALTGLCVLGGILQAHALNASDVSAAFEEMATKIAAAKKLRDAKLDSHLSSIQAELVGVFQGSSLKLSKGDEDVLDDVIGPSLIRRAEQGKLAFQSLVTDTFFNTFILLGVVDFLEVQYFCRKAQLANGTPVYLVAAQTTGQERYSVSFTPQLLQTIAGADSLGKGRVLSLLQGMPDRSGSPSLASVQREAGQSGATRLARLKEQLQFLAGLLGEGAVLVSQGPSDNGARQVLAKLAGVNTDGVPSFELHMSGWDYQGSRAEEARSLLFSLDSLITCARTVAHSDTLGFYNIQHKVPQLQTPLQKKVFLNSPEGQALRSSYASDRAALLEKTYWLFGIPASKTTYDLDKQAFCIAVRHDWGEGSELFFETAFPVKWNVDRKAFRSLQTELAEITSPPVTDECRQSLLASGLTSAIFGVSLSDGSEGCSQLEMAALGLYDKRRAAVCAKYGLANCKREGTLCLAVPENEAVVIEPLINTGAALFGFRITPELVDGEHLKCVDGQIAVCDLDKPRIAIIKRFEFR